MPKLYAKKYFDSIKSFFKIEESNQKFYLEIKKRKYEVIIYPAMLAEKFSKDKIYISDSFFKYAKPYIFNQIEDFLQQIL